jgi:S-adenosylmethionine hydrolase
MPIALITDFGTQDYYVGAMKGVILSINPQASIIDITHDIEPQNILSAAFVLSACYRDFPQGTIFVAVVDPGVGSERRAIVVEANGSCFVGPDNGIFSFVLGEGPMVYSLENDHYFYKPVSSTFHGRDIFAPVAAHLSLGVAPGDFGPRIGEAVQLSGIYPEIQGPNTISGRIIHTDRFGNLVTNITVDAAGEVFELMIADRSITELRQSYSGGEPGKPFAVAGSAGFIEVSVNGGSAAELLKVEPGTPISLRVIQPGDTLESANSGG